MKRIIAQPLMAVFLMLFFAVSCSERNEMPDEEVYSYNDKEDEITKSVRVDLSDSELSETTEVSFTENKDAALIIIESDHSWTAEVDCNWLRLSAMSGQAGKTGILAGGSVNQSVPRSGSISISSGTSSHSIIIKQEGARFINISAGASSFMMIRVEGDTFRLGDDDLFGSTPAFDVSLSSFYICETEITNSVWNSIMGRLPYDDIEEYAGHTEHLHPDYPVSAVTWNDIVNDFLPALKTATGITFRLPTEAEWEFAATGGKPSNTFDYAGSNDLDKVGWYSFNSGNSKHPVRKKLPNELGLYDMSGNVSEWCSDWYSYYYSLSVTNNPTGPVSGTEKVVRGGNFKTTPLVNVGECGVKYRSYLVPSGYNGCWGGSGEPPEPICFRCQALGFRLVIPVNQ